MNKFLHSDFILEKEKTKSGLEYSLFIKSLNEYTHQILVDELNVNIILTSYVSNATIIILGNIGKKLMRFEYSYDEYHIIIDDIKKYINKKF